MNAVDNTNSDDLLRKRIERELLDELAELRLSVERAEGRFFGKLVEIERSMRHIWQSGPSMTFDMWLMTHHVCESARYRQFARSADRIGLDNAVTVGYESAIKASKLKLPEKTVPQFVERVVAFERMNGHLPSGQTADKFVAELEPKEPAVLRGLSELASLRAQVRELSTEKRELEREVSRLRKENESLQKQLKKKPIAAS